MKSKRCKWSRGGFAVDKLIAGVESCKSTFFQRCLQPLYLFLLASFNLSPRLGKLPLEWKRSNVAPVFKKGDKSVISNYRPRSLLWIVSKLCERCILDKLILNLVELFSSKQHGFFPKKSCVTQLLRVLHVLGKALDAGQESDALYLDFNKAFDSVPHNLLLHKASLYGIDGPLYSWFSDYLHFRYQRVLMEGSFSS